MTVKSHENLKAIRFEGELLPTWAQLLDVAARLCEAPEETRHWFSKFTNYSGVDDARTVTKHCRLLRTSLEEHRESVLKEIQRNREDRQPSQILAAWKYALETMIQVAHSRDTCSWITEGAEELPTGDASGGDITLRRV